MVTTIKQGSTERIINELLKKLFSVKKIKGLDAHRYCGVLNLDKKALAIQKELRNEWE